MDEAELCAALRTVGSRVARTTPWTHKLLSVLPITMSLGCLSRRGVGEEGRNDGIGESLLSPTALAFQGCRRLPGTDRSWLTPFALVAGLLLLLSLFEWHDHMVKLVNAGGYSTRALWRRSAENVIQPAMQNLCIQSVHGSCMLYEFGLKLETLQDIEAVLEVSFRLC